MNIDKGIKSSALTVLKAEAKVIRMLTSMVDGQFVDAVTTVLDCSGRLVVIGVGKSGHIAGKIASTLASTGTPAFFVNAAEASHGDMGMIRSGDIALVLSNSGETKEVVVLLPLIERMKIPLIAITGNAESTLARASDFHMAVPGEELACPLGLAPMSSTTAMLSLGDAFAVAILEKRGFSQEQFALSHPGGLLGKKLILRVKDIMHTGSSVPKIESGASVLDVIVEITKAGLGFAVIINKENEVVGVFTDGDLRRILETRLDVLREPIDLFMTRAYKKVSKEKLAYETLTMMRDLKINGLPVVDRKKHLIGAVNLHDLLKLGFNP